MFMDDTDTYDARLRAIRAYNQPILDDFEDWLEQSGLSEKTVETHVSNIEFFTNYLVYYDNPLKKLDEATSGDVWMFLADWFPRKALWASVSSVKSYLASFKKFFRWMGETGRVSPETVVDVLDTLKYDRDTFLARADEF
jgi:site-specific recombinase XerD